jgi:hypothetical protein
MALGAGLALWPVRGVAQEERPHFSPGERKAPRKKDAEPRAIAVLNLSSDGKVSLVPITILINGKFWDASAYKASPVPMALEPGTVYEAEQDGSSIGLFTVGTALHSNAVSAPVPWLGTGAWVPAGTETEKKTQQHAEAAPVGLNTSDGPPRLTKNPAASTSSAPAGGGTPASAPSSTTSSSPAPSSSAPASGSGSGDEPPRLKRPAEPQSPPANSQPSSDSKGSSAPVDSDHPPSTPSPSTQPSSGQPSSGQSTSTAPPSTASQSGDKSGNKPDSSKPDKSGTKADAKKDDDSNAAPSDSGAGEGNRPRLRRGKPATSFADLDIPGYSKVDPNAIPKHGIVIATAASTTSAKPAAASPAATVQMIPAISDSAGPEPHSYGFEWLKDEEGERRQQLIESAQEQVRAYVEARAKATIAPKPAPAKTTAGSAAHRVPAKKTATPVLSDVKMTTYDLWSSNQPIMVFSAQAQMPPPPAVQAAAGTTPTPDLQYSVLLVAYPDIYNNLHKLYSGVTDKFHLDLTPRLELVDAVDADGDGRGELLFRETSDAGTGWVIYRATADKLWKMYDSLNPE